MHDVQPFTPTDSPAPAQRPARTAHSGQGGAFSRSRLKYPAVKMAEMKPDPLHLAWQYIDARALDQTKRADTRRTMLEDAARTDPAGVIEALATLACIAIDHAVASEAATRAVGAVEARRAVMLHIGHAVNH